jgi:hypothetical protein
MPLFALREASTWIVTAIAAPSAIALTAKLAQQRRRIFVKSRAFLILFC